ncbi:hypothetical protein IE983_25490 [Enterobacter hormaechei]|uniref:Uncharacterized protein n=1 Tax=Enterobacter hormaechei TaxID=158836 RepID=A0A927HMK6_9ENTR|nr:hypothetical protein [Enterobacter hormaechei]
MPAEAQPLHEQGGLPDRHRRTPPAEQPENTKAELKESREDGHALQAELLTTGSRRRTSEEMREEKFEDANFYRRLALLLRADFMVLT